MPLIQSNLTKKKQQKLWEFWRDNEYCEILFAHYDHNVFCCPTVDIICFIFLFKTSSWCFKFKNNWFNYIFISSVSRSIFLKDKYKNIRIRMRILQKKLWDWWLSFFGILLYQDHISKNDSTNSNKLKTKLSISKSICI